MKKKNRWILIAVLVLMGILYQQIGTRLESDKVLNVGKMLNVGAYQMCYYEKGEGENTYLLITGSGTPWAYSDFYRLQETLSKSAKTISFDRAGFGRSTKANRPRTIMNCVQEMNQLIENTQTKEVILVAHSLGGLEAIGYAQTYPEKVKGIIFLDAGSPEFYARDSEWKNIALNRAYAGIRILGVNRLLFDLGVRLPLYGEDARYDQLPKEVAKAERAFYLRDTGSFVSIDVIKEMNENAKVLCNQGKLSVPILVLSSDSGEEWQQVQEQLAGWSEESTQIPINGAKHYVHWSNFEEAEREILSFYQKYFEKIKENLEE